MGHFPVIELGRAITMTQPQGSVSLLGAPRPATLLRDSLVCSWKVDWPSEGLDLAVQCAARAWQWDGDWRAGDLSIHLTLPPNCQGTSVSPNVAGAGEQHGAQVTPSSQSLGDSPNLFLMASAPPGTKL